MPIRKFRSGEEMNRESWLEAGSQELFRAIRRVWSAGGPAGRPAIPPGVHKHRSIEEMNAFTESWKRRRFEAHRRGSSRDLG